MLIVDFQVEWVPGMTTAQQKIKCSEIKALQPTAWNNNQHRFPQQGNFQEGTYRIRVSHVVAGSREVGSGRVRWHGILLLCLLMQCCFNRKVREFKNIHRSSNTYETFFTFPVHCIWIWKGYRSPGQTPRRVLWMGVYLSWLPWFISLWSSGWLHIGFPLEW